MAKRKRLYKDKNALTVSTFKGHETHSGMEPPLHEELMASVHVVRGRHALRITPGPAGSIEIRSTSGRIILEPLGIDHFLVRKARKEPGGGV